MINNGMGRTRADFLKLWSIYQEKIYETFKKVKNNTEAPLIIWSSSLTEPNVVEEYINKDK